MGIGREIGTLCVVVLLAITIQTEQSLGQQPNCPPPFRSTGGGKSSEEPPLAGDTPAADIVSDPREPIHNLPPDRNPSPIIPVRGTEPVRGNQVVYPATPAVQLRVHAPAVAPNGQELAYRIELINPTRASALKVRLRAPKPALASFVTAEPPVTEETETEWIWDIGTMPAEARREVRLTIRPGPEAGQIKMCARVTFEHGQCVITNLSRPAISMEKDVPKEVVLFEPTDCRITLRNDGKVAISDLQVTETLGEGLYFPEVLTPEATSRGTASQPPFTTTADGRSRTWTVGTIAPGRVREIRFQIFPKKAGELGSDTVLTAASSVKREKSTKLTVLEPKLNIGITGPSQGQVDSPAEYRIQVANTGSAGLNNVRVTATLPAGSRTVKVSNGGQLFPGEVQWVVTRLEPGETKPLTLGVKSSQPGKRTMIASVRADRGLEQRGEIETEFLGVAALDFSAVGEPSTAKVGDNVRYVVEVTNVGTAPATNVVLIATLPASMEYVGAEPDQGVGVSKEQEKITFPPRVIAVGARATYILRAKAIRADQAKFRFELNADHLDKSQPPLSKEPATTVGGP